MIIYVLKLNLALRFAGDMMSKGVGARASHHLFATTRGTIIQNLSLKRTKPSPRVSQTKPQLRITYLAMTPVAVNSAKRDHK